MSVASRCAPRIRASRLIARQAFPHGRRRHRRTSTWGLLAAAVIGAVGSLHGADDSVRQDTAAAADASTSVAAAAPLPLRDRIDQATAGRWGNAAWPLADDAEFVRRVHLDLIGQIPSVERVRSFLADGAVDKRARLVESLLDDPRFVRRLADWYDVSVMERRPAVNVPREEWIGFLRRSFESDKSLRQLGYELLVADGTDERGRAAARFLLDRDVDTNVLVRDVGRLWFGVDLQCAQCHDHPHINSYRQSDYYGLYAALLRSSLFKDAAGKAFVAEKADGEHEFVSVFTEDKGTAKARLIDGWIVPDGPIPTDLPYVVAPADGVRAVPSMSRRERFAEALLDSPDRSFARNWSNRLWALMFGRGLVQPLDLHHADNPATDPILLEALTDGLIEGDFSARSFVREIALSRTYQATFDIERAMSADPALEQAALVDATAALTTTSDAQAVDAESAAYTLRIAASDAWLEANAAYRDAAAPLLAAERRLTEAQQAEAADIAQRERLTTIVDSNRGIAAKLSQAAIAFGLDPTSLDVPLFTARGDAASAEIAAIEARATERQATIASAVEAIAAARPAADAARETLDRRRTDLERAWRTWETARRELAVRRELQARIESVAARRAAIEECDAVEAELAGVRVQFAEHERRGAEAGASRELLTARLAEARLEVERRTVESTGAEQRYRAQETSATRHRQVASELERSLVALRNAADLWPGDSTLESTLGPIAARYDAAKRQAETVEGEQQRTNEERRRAIESTEAAERLAVEVETELAAAAAALARFDSELTALRGEVERLERRRLEAEQRWVEIAERQGAIAALAPLTPEQLGWSVLQGTGVLQNTIDATRQELNAAAPATDAQASDPAWLAAREREALVGALDKLEPSIGVFISLFGNGAAQPQDGFFATADQSLFFANGGTIGAWAASGGNSLRQRAAAVAADPNAAADELALTLFARPATELEKAWVAESLSAAGDQLSARLDELIWAWIAAAEFRFDR